ncbi:hypothetical protein ACLIX2_11770 [Proteus cibi]
MNMKVNSLNPNILFSKKNHQYPIKEKYTFIHKIDNIKNISASPSFYKRVINAITYIFNKIEIKFLIRDIKNNKLINVIDVNEHQNKISESIINNGTNEVYNLDYLKEMISHSNDKFDFYSFCDYLAEVERVKNFFSTSENINSKCYNNNLINETLSNIISHRINSINSDGLYNIIKLSNLKFRFENIFLHKKHVFMNNFSSLKKRKEFIKVINLIVLIVRYSDVLFDINADSSARIRDQLREILTISLDKNKSDKISFNNLITEWSNKYINKDFSIITEEIAEEEKEKATEIKEEKMETFDKVKLEEKIIELKLLLDDNDDDLIEEIERIKNNIELKEEDIKEKEMVIVDEIEERKEEEIKRLARESAEEEANEIFNKIKENAEKEVEEIFKKIKISSGKKVVEEPKINISELGSKEGMERKEENIELLNKTLNVFSSMKEFIKKYNEIDLIDREIKEVLSSNNQEINIEFDKNASEVRKIIAFIHNGLVSIKSSLERNYTELEKNAPYDEMKKFLIKLKENLDLNISNSIGEMTKVPIDNNIKELMNEFELYLSKMRGILLDDDDVTPLNNNASRSESELIKGISKVNSLDLLNEKIDDIQHVLNEVMPINVDENYLKTEGLISSLMGKIDKEINRKVINEDVINNKMINKTKGYDYSIISGSDFVTKTKENIEKNRELRKKESNPIINKKLNEIINGFLDKTINKEHIFKLLNSEIENIQEKNKRKKEQYNNERKAPVAEDKIKESQRVEFYGNKLKNKEDLNVDKTLSVTDIDNSKGLQSNFVFEDKLHNILFNDYSKAKNYRIEDPFVIFDLNESENNNDKKNSNKIKFNFTNGNVLYLINNKIKSNKSLIKDYINSGIEKNINEFINKEMKNNINESSVDKKTDNNFQLAIDSIVIAINEDLSNKRDKKNKK